MNERDKLKIVTALNEKLTVVMQDHIDKRLLEMEVRIVDLQNKKDPICFC